MKNGKQMVYILIGCAMILLSIGLIVMNKSFGGDSKETKRSGTSVYTEPIKELDLDIGACEFDIVIGEKSPCMLSYEDAENAIVSDSLVDGVLTISCKQKSNWLSNLFKNGGNSTAKLTLTLPEETVFERADLKFGAAEVEIEWLLAEELKMALGAGAVDVISMWATDKAEIEVGAGALIAESAILKNAQITCGVGEVEMAGMITGESTVECGVGEINLEVYGEEADYYGKLDCGLGEVNCGTVNISGSGKKEYGTTSAENRMDIKCGIGEVNVQFRK